jgi:hypothetical protein
MKRHTDPALGSAKQPRALRPRKKETKMSQLKNKIAVVTGGTSGIGLATAKRFFEEGAYVFIAGRRQAEIDKAVAEIGRDVTGIKTDISKLDDLDRFYETIAKKGNQLSLGAKDNSTARWCSGDSSGPLGRIRTARSPTTPLLFTERTRHVVGVCKNIVLRHFSVRKSPNHYPIRLKRIPGRVRYTAKCPLDNDLLTVLSEGFDLVRGHFKSFEEGFVETSNFLFAVKYAGIREVRAAWNNEFYIVAEHSKGSIEVSLAEMGVDFLRQFDICFCHFVFRVCCCVYVLGLVSRNSLSWPSREIALLLGRDEVKWPPSGTRSPLLARRLSPG